MSLVEKAKAFATKAHEGQVRKYTGEAYVTHPIAVASIYKGLFAKNKETLEEATIAALLHDTVEDTSVTIEEVRAEFGDKVAQYVWFLTKPESFVGNRKVRKALDIARLKEAPLTVKALKLCDVYHNTASIEKHDPKFWVTFKSEAKKLIEEAELLEAAVYLSDSAFENVIAPWLDTLYK